MSDLLKVLLASLILVSLINSSSCLLNKMNTNLVVFGEYDEEIGKLDIEAKLTYINTDTSEKKPLVGRELKTVINVSKNDGTNYSIEKYGTTNQIGWVRQTFYLDDAKEYQVIVYFDGDSGFKESIGTVGGGGEYEEQSYTTNLPEGVSLTTCLPVLVLIGLLGAAMYASGGNPFGFVDMTTTRGFRMNRNLRKVMFVQGLGGTIGSFATKGLQIIMNIAASKQSGAEEKGDKDQEEAKKGDDKKKGEKEPNKGEAEQPKPAPLPQKPQGSTQKDTTSKGGQQEKVTLEKVKDAAGKEKTITIKEKYASEGFYKAARWINIIGAIFTGDSMTNIDMAKNISKAKVGLERAAIINKYTSLNSKKEDAFKMLTNQELARKIAKDIKGNNDKKIEELDKKIEKERGKGTPLLSPELRKLRELKKGLENENKGLEKEIKNIDKKVEIAQKTFNKIIEIENKIKEKTGLSIEEIGKLNATSVQVLLGDNKESKEMYQTIMKVMETNIKFEGIIQNKIDQLEEVTELKIRINQLNENSEEYGVLQKRINFLSEEIPNVENITTAQKFANYAIENENGVKNLVEMDDKKLGLHNQMLAVGGKAIEEIERQNEDLKKLESAIRNPEEYKMIMEIKERIKDGTASKEDFEVFKDNRILFDDNLQKEVMQRQVITIDENGTMKTGITGMTLQDRFNEIESIKEEYKIKTANDIKTLYDAGASEKVIAKVEEELKNQMNEKIDIFSSNNEYIYNNNTLVDAINMNKRQIFDGLKDVNMTEHNVEIIQKALNPESNKEFAEDYNKINYEEFRKKEMEIYRNEVAIGLRDVGNLIEKSNKNIDWQNETSSKLAKNIDEMIVDTSKEKRVTDDQIKEMVGQYEVMKKFDPTKDESYERSEKITGVIDKEIKKVMKEIKSESSTAFATEEEQASLGRLKKREEELNLQKEKLNVVKETIEFEKKQKEFETEKKSFFASKEKNNKENYSS